MENRFDNKYRQMNSTIVQVQRRKILNNQFGSPKFTRKKPEIPNFLARKLQKKQEQAEHFTYISPKKYLENQFYGNDSTKSVTSISSFNRSQRARENFLENIQNNEQIAFSESCLANLKLEQRKKYEKQEEMLTRVSINPEMDELKNENLNMERKIHELTEKGKVLKEENNYLIKKIQDFSEVIKQKNQIINHFSQLLRCKDNDLNYSQNQLKFYRKKNQELENIISFLNKTIEQSPQCSNETEDSERQNYQKQIQKYKAQIEQLIETVKYSEMQSSMYQKLRYDLSYQIERNETLKNQNKKLIARVEYLSSPKSNIEKERLNPLTMGRRNLKQSQISLELSPEK